MLNFSIHPHSPTLVYGLLTIFLSDSILFFSGVSAALSTLFFLLTHRIWSVDLLVTLH